MNTNKWHKDYRHGDLVCRLFGHILFKPSPTSEIEQCKACLGWKYIRGVKNNEH